MSPSYDWPPQTIGAGTVTSVGLADASTVPIFSISGSPVTTNGTLTETLVTQAKNLVFSGPSSGSDAQPTFRALVSADLPFAITNLTDAGTDGIVITNGTGAVIGASPVTIAQHVADASHNGYLSSTDWSTFNSKQAALTIGNLTDAGTDGIVVTGGTGAVIGSGTSIAQHVADTSHSGYLSSTDWNTFNGKQAALTIGNLTDAGTDGITVTGGTGSVIGSGTSIAQHVADTTHNGYLSSTDWNTFNGKGSGTVTSVSASGPTGIATWSSAVTGSGTLTQTLSNQSANTFLAGPATGGATTPAFRALTTADFVAPTIQAFTSSSGTYTTPTSPRTPLYLIIEMVGGGGGGGGSGTTSGTAATNGGDTTFSVHSGSAILTAGGGKLGARGADGGAGGTPTIAAGATKIVSAIGGMGQGDQNEGNPAAVVSLMGGQGGSSAWGGAGAGASTQGTNAGTGQAAGANTGGGGGGAAIGATTNGQTGSGGGSGAFIKAIITSPSASYDYAVGGAGTGQANGTSGSAGGNGGSGYIVVTEYYQ